MSALGKLKLAVQSFVVPRFLRYGKQDLVAALQEMGVQESDTLMVHSSLRPHNGFDGRPVDILDAFKTVVGPSGLLIMPSLTYTDSSKAFLHRQEVLDVRKSISRMGLLTEVFRRGRDVVRSLSPTHPLLARGDRAEWFVSGHEATDIPFGPASPFGKLVELDAKILCFDAPLGAVTFAHFLDDHVKASLPFSLYEEEPLTGVVRDAHGQEYTVPTFVLSDETRKRRHEEQLWHAFRRAGLLRSKRLGNTRLHLLRCRDLLRCAETLQQRGQLYFDMTERA